MPRTYWYCWWAGTCVGVIATAIVTRVEMALLAAVSIVVVAVVIWLGSMAAGVYFSKMTILRRFSFYWSLVLLVLSVVVLYWILAWSARRVIVSATTLSEADRDFNDPAIQALVNLVLFLPLLLLVFVVGGWIVVSLWVGRVAQDKGRSKVAWFWLAMLLPLISWIIVATMTSPRPLVAISDQDTGPIPTVRASTKKCPMCAEEILLEAKKCRHCGEYFDGVPSASTVI